MNKSKSEQIPQDLFESTYQQIWQDRWPHLLKALKEPVQKVGFIPDHMSNLSKNLEVKDSELNLFDNDEQGYQLDYASSFPVKALDISRDQKILDMCSAPGGKALLIAHLMKGTGELTLNDISKSRAFRLKRVMNEFSTDMGSRLKITNKDASKWCLKHPESYDRILLDAPCSSERHLIHMPNEMKKWKPNKSKQVAMKQYALLSSGLLCLKPGGLLVYSTCSINPKENDLLIDRIVSRKSDLSKVMPLEFPIGEPTSHGWQFLPDQTGIGPIYLSKLCRFQ